jgi:membrane associated rhomboid family serine protease
MFTSMFMHAGFLHIAGNMLYLWIFGNNIEDAIGHVRFLLFYLACGVLAAIAHIFVATSVLATPISPYVQTVGASGAIAGVLGAYLWLYPRNKIRTLVPIGFFLTDMDVPAVLVLGIWFVAQFLGLGAQAGSGVAYGAHVGGFVAGLVIILLLGGRKLARPRRGYYRSLNRY